MALNNGWIKIETVSGSGDTAVAAEILERNTGRSVTRTATVVGTTAHGAEATAVFTQGPSPLFITVDHFEDEYGAVAVNLAAVGGTYYIVGYSNVDFMSAAETTTPKTFTDLDDSGTAYTNGFTLIDGNGSSHTIGMETGISYGTDVQYTFKIPFEADENDTVSDRVIYFELTDDGDTRAAATVTQVGKQSDEET